MSTTIALMQTPMPYEIAGLGLVTCATLYMLHGLVIGCSRKSHHIYEDNDEVAAVNEGPMPSNRIFSLLAVIGSITGLVLSILEWRNHQSSSGQYLRLVAWVRGMH